MMKYKTKMELCKRCLTKRYWLTQSLMVAPWNKESVQFILLNYVSSLEYLLITIRKTCLCIIIIDLNVVIVVCW